MNIVYLGLGTNLGDKTYYLNQALHYIGQRIGRIISRSSFYDTAPWGFVSDNRFLNAVAKIETPLFPEEILRDTQLIEKELGRKAKSDASGYADRSIDIDILFFNDEIIQKKHLTIPHPQIEHRDFVLLPLVEIAPDLRHPVLGRTMRELLQSLLKDKR